MINTLNNNEPDYRLASDKFCYWLQGFFELTNAESMTPEQVKMVKEHLNMVFTHKVSVPAAADYSRLSQFMQQQPGTLDAIC